MGMRNLLSRPSAPVLLVFLLLIAPASASADEFYGNFNLLLGQKMMDEDDWDPVDLHDAAGIEATWGGSEWPFHIATDVYYSTDEEDNSSLDADVTTIEVGLGIREIRTLDNFNWYLGVGIGLIQAELEIETSSGEFEEDDSGIGGWASAGVFWRFGSHFNVGVGIRYSKADVDLFGEEFDAGGFNYGILLGMGFPAYGQ